MTKVTNHSLPTWTEVEYTSLCKNPYLDTPFYVPKESKCFLCGEDGSRKEMKNIYLVYKSVDASEDDEWEDDPMPGEMWVSVLGDDGEEIEPAKAVYLGQDVEDLVRVVHEDDNNIIFDIYWRHGDVKVEKSEKTDEGFVCKKENFGDEGLRLTLIPKEGAPFTLHLVIPYLGFSLYDGDGKKVHDEVEISHDRVDDYRYEFVGDESNDRFTLNLDHDKLVYLCVLRPHEGKLVVRDQRERLAIVDELPSEGKLADLMMGAHHALVKNKNYRWRISLKGTSAVAEEISSVDPETLVKFARGQFEKSEDRDALGGHLIALESKYGFQWCWLNQMRDWSHDDAAFDQFMTMLTAFSYINQKPIQGDQLQARNNKRKIRRCARLFVANQRGEESLWEADEETREELIHLFGTFHDQFVEAVEEELKIAE